MSEHNPPQERSLRLQPLLKEVQERYAQLLSGFFAAHPELSPEDSYEILFHCGAAALGHAIGAAAAADDKIEMNTLLTNVRPAVAFQAKRFHAHFKKEKRDVRPEPEPA